MVASPLQRRLGLFALGGAGIAVTVLLGPFLLIGIGGLAGLVGFRFWQLKRQLRNTPLEKNWQSFMSDFLKEQNGGMLFGKEQVKLQDEAMKRFSSWTQSEQGRDELFNYGIHPERISQQASMRGSSYSSNSVQAEKDIKIELDLMEGAVLVAQATVDNDGNMSIRDIKLVTSTGHTLQIPLHPTQGRGRIIEGEFRDV
ncbi:hypothetical protein K501DRAFT_257993 [Backusella circina FSU 941]|nr:hypothetical protein K501DRAFT_257993 [Backusella circina FSU 941]